MSDALPPSETSPSSDLPPDTSTPRRVARPLVLAMSALAALLAAFLAFGLPKLVDVEMLFVDSVYWVLWVALVLLASALVAQRTALSDWRWSRAQLLTVGAALAGAALIVCSVGTAYRVLADEANLMSTSLSLYEHHTLTNIVETLNYYDVHHIVTEGVAARPGLFPFAAMLVHTVFGFDAAHGFVVNFFAAAGTLLSLYLIGRRMAGNAYGVFAALALISLPIFTLSATSAGFDALNLLLIALFSLQLLRFFERPDAVGFELLLLCAILGAHTRYETIWLLAPALVAGTMHARRLLADRLSWRLPLMPLLLVPIVWQKALTSVRNGPSAAEDALPTFSLEHVGGNLQHALAFYVKEPLFYLAVAGVALLVVQLVRRRSPLRAPVLLIGLAGALIAFTHMAFYLGDISTAHNRRLAVAHLVVLALCAAYPLAAAWRVRGLRVALAGVVAVGLTLGLGRAAQDELGRALTMFREYQANLAFLERYPPETTLVISEWPVLYVPHGFSAVSSARANAEAGRFRGNLDSHLFSDVLAIQTIRFEDEKPVAPLDERFVLERLYEYQNSANERIRISRVR